MIGAAMRIRAIGLGLIVIAACTSDDVTTDELLDGFNPPKPAAGQIQLISPIVRGIAAGADATMCTYFPRSASLPTALDVTHAVGYQSQIGAHHAILYQARQARPVDTHPCTEDDMVNSIPVAINAGAEGGDAAFEIPAGLAFRLEAEAQFFVQTHWVNASDAAIDGQAAFTLTAQPVSTAVQPASLFSFVDTQISIPAGGPGHEGTTCTFQRDISFVTMGGHAHEHGTAVRLFHKPAGQAEQTIYDHAWSPPLTFAMPVLKYGPQAPFVVHAGDSLRADCEYMNTTANELQFPSEMCGGFGFYFPGSAQLNCTDGNWPQ
jgi:hypothetical protein